MEIKRTKMNYERRGDNLSEYRSRKFVGSKIHDDARTLMIDHLSRQVR